MARIPITRLALSILPDPTRVLARPFLAGDETLLAGKSRAPAVMERVLAIPEPDVGPLLADLLARFGGRHRHFIGRLERHFDRVRRFIDDADGISDDRRRLVGAYFSHEYSVEAAALFNPSIVLAPDQSGLSAHQRRFILSVRAVGEGHLSSIGFRTGVLDDRGNITLDPPGPFLDGGERSAPDHYDRHLFGLKLSELGAGSELASSVLDRLPEQFTLAELEASLTIVAERGPPAAISFETTKIIRVLAASNYMVRFAPDSDPGERVIFPAGPNETRGMEDARFVRFVSDLGEATYYATYTAYDGFEILPQLIETRDFATFRISTLNGSAAQNKGMALFPRRVGGSYMMLSRRDRENLHLSTSDHVRFWNDVSELYRPTRPWELLQIGNCGSPLETEAGWIVLTHGVGAMRRYVIGAILLDREDPRRVIGSLREPLLEPDDSERDGYVPNVVYTCGGIIAGDRLVLPYAYSDSGIRFAHLSIADLLTELSAAKV